MAKLLILGPTYTRNTDPKPIPAIERYDGAVYRIIRKNLERVAEKGIDILIITEDLDVITSDTKLPYKPPVGESWRERIQVKKDLERIKRLRNQILELVSRKDYEEVFIALSREYQELLPDLTPYVKKIISNFRGFGLKLKALKQWLLN